MSRYNPKDIEGKWQKKWLEEKVFRAKDDSPKPKYYQLETFPYPSAAGLHIGHPKGFVAEDVHARYMRMRGHEVLYTMGWDAFGLPTENYAIKVGRDPNEVALENVTNFRRQVRMFGFSYDWEREIDTSSPEYYRWTQWLFIQFFKKGLAYRAAAKVNWCPKDQTVLANEQVADGKCERCGSEIEERDMEQWFFRITQYAKELLDGLRGLDWPAATIKRQEDWIGHSTGAEIDFSIEGEAAPVTVFTTRPDTIFGATYLVLAPEHPLVKKILPRTENKKEIEEYLAASFKKTERMRQQGAKEKTGACAKGVWAINPATKEKIPVWVADYVLGGYGTGAIMAVPAHDERDFEFAEKFHLPVRVVVSREKMNGAPAVPVNVREVFTTEGYAVNSGKFDGMGSSGARSAIADFVGGRPRELYKLRDWSVSRQRYWGVPVPMIHCAKCGIVPVPEKDLPVVLPRLSDYRPHGVPPLASSKEFMEIVCPSCAAAAHRDPETLDTFVDSAWYYLRYADPRNDVTIFDKAKAKHWLPVDLYIIGAEHTVLHLLYSRFVTKFLYSEGLLPFREPFAKLRHQGLILGADGQKMSKSKGNVVNPDELVAEFGADTVRTYLMFMGPFEDGQPWDAKGILGAERFLARVWKYAEGWKDVGAVREGGAGEKNGALTVLFHRTIKKVGEDIEQLKFNTAISALMILLNHMETASEDAPLTRAEFESFIKLVHPFAPHLAQEIWSRLHNESYLDFAPWPEYDPALVAEGSVTLVFQVNGRVRDAASVPAAITEEEAKELALKNQKVQKALGGAAPKRVIYVERKLVNIVL